MQRIQDKFLKDLVNLRKAVLSTEGKQPQIIFTGFNKQLRSELERLATENGLKVVKQVNKSLDYFVFGDHAGELKFKTAWHQGVAMMREDQFRTVVG